MSQKAQSSVEYLFIVVLSLSLILPASFLFFDFSKSSEDAIINSQINRIGGQIKASAEEVYVIGQNSRITLELALPDVITDATIYRCEELVIEYYTQVGLSQAVFFLDVPLTNRTVVLPETYDVSDCCASSCDLPLTAGKNNLRLTSMGRYVAAEVN